MTRSRTTVLFAGLSLFAAGWTGCSGTAEKQASNPDDSSAAASPDGSAGADEAPTEVATAETGGAAEPAAPTQPEPEPPGVRGTEPLPADLAEVFRRGEGEQLGKAEITYLKTNERRHDVWFPYIEGKGGAYLGVGSDQNFTLIGVAKSELVFFTDIDPRVPRLHALYEALVEAAETPEAHLQLWAPKNEESTQALLEEAFADRDEEERRVLLREFRADRETVWRHLNHVAERTEDGANTSWLSNPEYYAHLRKLYQSDRIRYEAGDLTGKTTMKLAGDIFRELDIPLGVLYLSNAEEYFTYIQSYRDNIANLPADDGSMVLRTIYNKERNKDYEMADALWNYQVQYLEDFQARLEEKENSTRNRMIRKAEKDGEFERHPEVSGTSRLNVDAAN